MQTIGVLGLGKIGTPMAENLMKGGFKVVGYRRSPTPELEAAGMVRASSPQAVGEAADIVLSCLPSAAALDEAMAGGSGLVHSARPGQIVVELGSYELEDKARQLDRFKTKGAHFIDGEISGTPGMVAARKGAVFLAGDAQACEKAKPVISAIAESQFYFGAFGAATKVKLINNLLVTLNVAATAEAMQLVLKSGVDVKTAITAITQGSGSSTMFAIRAPWMAERKFLPAQGEIRQLAHYIDGVGRLAGEIGCATPMLDRARELFDKAHDMDLDKHDVAAMLEVLEASDPAPASPSAQKKRNGWNFFGRS